MSRIEDWRQAVKARGMMPRKGVHRNTYYYRDRVLSQEGFIPSEREAFCTGRIGTQSMRAMRAERRMAFAEYKEDAEKRMRDKGIEYGSSKYTKEWAGVLLNWRGKITASYRAKGWEYNDGGICPWFYLEDVRERRNLNETPRGRYASLLDGDDILAMFTVPRRDR